MASQAATAGNRITPVRVASISTASISTSDSTSRPRVAICIPTYRRPAMLERLLKSLSNLEFRSSVAPEITVIVVDNDRSATARIVAETARSHLPWALLYEVEPERSISLARNRAITAARNARSDFVAFLDDDEIPHGSWLDELLHAKERSAADIVGGPILPVFDREIPDWLQRSGLYDIPRHPTGSHVEMVFTGNVLIGSAWLAEDRPKFDVEFGRTGGEDSHFFMRARREGARIVWADAAIVHEEIPRSKGSVRWVLARAFRIGSQTVRSERSILPLRSWLIPRFLKAGARMVQGLVLLLPSLLLGRAAAVAALRRVAHGAGCLAGMLGVRIEEYEVTHGS
jgi:succinoglycan biosynthesis protein ExoM